MPRQTTNVFIGGLNRRVVEKDIDRFFQNYQNIQDIALKDGFCFVKFGDYREAEDACYELNGRDILGDRVKVEIARGTPHGRDRDTWESGESRDRGRGGDRGRDDRGFDRRRNGFDHGDRRDRRNFGPPIRTNYRLIVENLSSRVSWQDLKNYMRQAGEVTFTDTYPEKKEGCVEFISEKDMKSALDMLDGHELNGRRIKLFEDEEAKAKRPNSRSGGGFRSKSRSRSPRSRTRSPSRTRSRGSSDKGGRSRSKSKSRSRSPPLKIRSTPKF